MPQCWKGRIWEISKNYCERNGVKLQNKNVRCDMKVFQCIQIFNNRYVSSAMVDSISLPFSCYLSSVSHSIFGRKKNYEIKSKFLNEIYDNDANIIIPLLGYLSRRPISTIATFLTYCIIGMFEEIPKTTGQHFSIAFQNIPKTTMDRSLIVSWIELNSGGIKKGTSSKLDTHD